MAEGFLTPAEVAALLRLRVQTVYEYIRLGRLPAVRLRKGYRISREDLSAFLEASKTVKRDTLPAARLELDEGKAPGEQQGG